MRAVVLLLAACLGPPPLDNSTAEALARPLVPTTPESLDVGALMGTLSRCACDAGAAECDRASAVVRAGWYVGSCAEGVGAWQMTKAGAAAGAGGVLGLGEWRFAAVTDPMEGTAAPCDDHAHTVRWRASFAPMGPGAKLRSAGYPGLDMRGAELEARCQGGTWKLAVPTGAAGGRAGEFPPF